MKNKLLKFLKRKTLNEFKNGQGNRGKVAAFLLSRPEALEFIKNFPDMVNSVHIKGYELKPSISGSFDVFDVKFVFNTNNSKDINLTGGNASLALKPSLKSKSVKIDFGQVKNSSDILNILFEPLESFLIKKYFGKSGGIETYNCRISTLCLASRLMDVMSDNYDMIKIFENYDNRIVREARKIIKSESFKTEFHELREKHLSEGLMKFIKEFVNDHEIDDNIVDRAIDELKADRIINS
jgi:hypothetical protein